MVSLLYKSSFRASFLSSSSSTDRLNSTYNHLYFVSLPLLSTILRLIFLEKRCWINSSTTWCHSKGNRLFITFIAFIISCADSTCMQIFLGTMLIYNFLFWGNSFACSDFLGLRLKCLEVKRKMWSNLLLNCSKFWFRINNILHERCWWWIA